MVHWQAAARKRKKSFSHSNYQNAFVVGCKRHSHFLPPVFIELRNFSSLASCLFQSSRCYCMLLSWPGGGGGLYLHQPHSLPTSSCAIILYGRLVCSDTLPFLLCKIIPLISRRKERLEKESSKFSRGGDRNYGRSCLCFSRRSLRFPIQTPPAQLIPPGKG